MVYLFLANGFEEIEALSVVDILRRAEIPVLTVGTLEKMVEGSHGIKVESDITLDDIELDKIEAIVLPGGIPGATNLLECEKLKNILQFSYDNNLYICAICAAPMILGKMGFLKGKKATCFPGYEKDLEGAIYTGDKVCTDLNIITSKGAGTALDFSYKIVEILKNKETAESLSKVMQYE